MPFLSLVDQPLNRFVFPPLALNIKPPQLGLKSETLKRNIVLESDVVVLKAKTCYRENGAAPKMFFTFGRVLVSYGKKIVPESPGVGLGKLIFPMKYGRKLFVGCASFVDKICESGNSDDDHREGPMKALGHGVFLSLKRFQYFLIDVLPQTLAVSPALHFNQ